MVKLFLVNPFGDFGMTKRTYLVDELLSRLSCEFGKLYLHNESMGDDNARLRALLTQSKAYLPRVPVIKTPDDIVDDRDTVVDAVYFSSSSLIISSL